MKQNLNATDKLNLFTVFSSSTILLIGGFDAFWEHQGFANADAFVATASLITFLVINILGFALSHFLFKPLHKAIDDLKMESDETAAASVQVEAASSELAEASLEESASIQETAATLEETSSMIQQNSINTQEAAQITKQTMQLSEKSYSEMQQLLDYMEKLKISSNKIEKIMKLIENIAFQTNILSLNASVEAAKVGNEGNSFAVVASAIRDLAQKSDIQSKETEDIIKENIKLVNEGLNFAKDVEDSLSEIDSESKRISKLMEEIAQASTEQSRGVDEIHKAIVQMETVAHSNAHCADECASAAKSLSSQTFCVKGIINDLNLLIKGSNNKSTKNDLELNAQNLQQAEVLVK